MIWTRGTTESINLVAATWGMDQLKEGDEILLSVMEHHSNIVPWQMLSERAGTVLRVVPINDRGEIDLIALRGHLVVFCEVKTRRSDAFGAPIEAVTETTTSLWKLEPGLSRLDDR